MNFVYKITATILLIPLILGSVFLLSNFGYLDNAIRHGMQYYLNLKGYNCSITDLTFSHGTLIIKQLKTEDIRTKINMHLDDISGTFLINMSDFTMEGKILINALSVYQSSEQLLATNKVTASILVDKTISTRKCNILLSDITLSEIGISKGNAEFTFEQNNSVSSFLTLINLSQSSFWHGKVTHTTDKMEAFATFKNIPIKLGKIASAFAPNNNLLQYLSTSLTSGIITKGSIDISLDNKYLKHGIMDDSSNISSEFTAEDVTYSYNPDMPEIKHASMNGYTKGLITEIVLSSASVANFNFPDTTIIVDLKDDTNGIVNVKGAGKGPVVGLTEFIPLDTMNGLKNADIDLTKFTGNADVDLNLTIPLNPEMHNKFDIKADIPATSLNIFADKIKLSEAKFSGRLLDNNLNISGIGKVNNMPSDIIFTYNIDHKNPACKLNVNSKLKDTNKDNYLAENFDFIRYKNANSTLTFDYQYLNHENIFEIYSDLTDIDIYIDKLGMHKQKGENAILSATGILQGNSGYNFDFAIRGKQTLDIKGNISHEDDRNILSIPTLKHGNTDISLDIANNKDNNDIKITGKALDLNQANLMQYLQKGQHSSDQQTHVKANIKEVKLKNDIWLDNLMINLASDKVGSMKGKITADIGSRSIDVNVTSDKENEYWEVFSSNAGATLKALGMYNDMRAGTMNLKIQTNTKRAKSGQGSSEYFGNFNLEKFALGNTPFLTRIISVVSLPGFLGMVTNNKDIIFSSMKGEFTFTDNIIDVKHSLAEGPFFSFSLNGNIDIMKKNIDVKGHVTPELYGISSMVKTIPVIGKYIAGDKSGGGLISTSYKIQQDY